jgi:hypothetical protein
VGKKQKKKKKQKTADIRNVQPHMTALPLEFLALH